MKTNFSTIREIACIFNYYYYGRNCTAFFQVNFHCIDFPLKQQQHTIHDPHDEMRGSAQGANSSNVRRLDGLRQQGRLSSNLR